MFADNLFKNVFGKVEPGLCRLSLKGDIAIKTEQGYRVYNLKTKRLTNCDNFVLDIGNDFFFVMPTNKLAVGDVIIANGKPKCIVDVSEKDAIKVVSYTDSTIETLIPERHMFLGETYMYGKIVSLFSGIGGSKDGMANNIMNYALMSQLFNGKSGSSDMSAMLPFMLMQQNGNGNIFGNLFATMSDCFTGIAASDDSKADETVE